MAKKKKPTRRKRKPLPLPEGWNRCGCGMQVPPEKPCPMCEHDGSFKKAGIVLDAWKLQTFIRILEKNEYSFSHGAGITNGTRNIYVMTDNPPKLRTVVEQCEAACIAEKN